MAPLDLVVEAPGRVPPAKAASSGGILGDVDNTGDVDFFDALLVALYSHDSSTVMPNNGDIISLGDVNADGQVDLADAWLIAAYLNDSSDPSLPAGIGEPVASAASLSPEPSTVTFADDGAWHRFTVAAGEPVTVVANPQANHPAAGDHHPQRPRQLLPCGSRRRPIAPGRSDDLPVRLLFRPGHGGAAAGIRRHGPAHLHLRGDRHPGRPGLGVGLGQRQHLDSRTILHVERHRYATRERPGPRPRPCAGTARPTGRFPPGIRASVRMRWAPWRLPAPVPNRSASQPRQLKAPTTTAPVWRAFPARGVATTALRECVSGWRPGARI